MEHSTVPNAICELWKRFNKCKGTCDDGAINDLRMEGSAIRNLNTGNFSRKIAVHSIATTRDLADVQGVLNRTDILESILGSDWFAPFRIMFGFADIAKSIGCVGNDLFDNEQNDCIVGLRSQLGGLTGSHVTRVINQMHMGAQENQDVIVAVRSLLNTPPNSDKFSNYGYQPRPAGYGYSLNIAECIEEAQARVFSIDQLSKINIEVSQSPVSGSSNQNIRITGEGPPNISTLLLLLEIDINHTIYGRKQGSSAVFDVDMPFNSFGNKGITMVGYDFNNRKLVYGKSTVTIQPLSSIIAIHIDPAEVYVQKDKSTPLRIIGTDVNNKAYDLTNLAGVDFQFDNNYARRDGGGVFGVNLGSDTLKVSFNGKSSEKIPINVLDCRNVATIPIELLSFTGKAHKGRNQLNWQTATEQNNKGFHIERSSDGQSWQSIGWVSGKGNSSSIVVYELFDESPLNISYYRLRQVDFDEKPTISKAITLVQWSDNEIIIYPNPSSDALNITTSEALIGKEYTVTNTLGVSVLSGVIKDKSMALSIKNMPNGVYFLHILGTTTATKFIKE